MSTCNKTTFLFAIVDSPVTSQTGSSGCGSAVQSSREPKHLQWCSQLRENTTRSPVRKENGMMIREETSDLWLGEGFWMLQHLQFRPAGPLDSPVFQNTVLGRGEKSDRGGRVRRRE